MLKKIMFRGIFSFAGTVTVNVFIMMGKTVGAINSTGNPQALPELVPEYAAYFENPFMALMVQTLLCGLIGFAFGACSVVTEVAKWSMVRQAVTHFVVTACAWAPVSVFCWGLGRYIISFISIFISMVITYTVTWTIQIVICRREVAQINEQLCVAGMKNR